MAVDRSLEVQKLRKEYLIFYLKYLCCWENFALEELEEIAALAGIEVED